jgi:hypothetical protein
LIGGLGRQGANGGTIQGPEWRKKIERTASGRKSETQLNTNVRGVGIRDVLGVGGGGSGRHGGRRRRGGFLQMRTARDENVPRFIVDKPRLKSESKVICERKAVA